MTANGPSIQIHINQTGSWPLPRQTLAAGCRAALGRDSVRSGEVSVTFLDDQGISDLNQEYLGRSGPTDVISFPLHDEGDPVLADIYVGLQQARRQADEMGIPLEEELLRLTIHGTLHALGYQHSEGPDRSESEMFQIQEELVAAVLDDGSHGER